MVMIRCPDCGQRVLDIATSCPQCHRVLLQNPLETHDWGTLRECGRCHKHIERDAAVCPYCGHHVRAARLAARVVAVLVVLAVLTAAGFAAWRSGVLDTVLSAVAAGRPASHAPPPVATPEPVVPATPEPAEVTAAPIVAAAPGDSPTAAEAEAPPTPPPAAAPPAASGLVRRWVGEWANVRTARDVTSQVVRVLAPNVAVEVGDMRRGWWALYLDGTFVGYIANSVLRTEPGRS
jgi:RNA polymerase subunit RPABC4/transcription elongation factor Spt4